MKMETTPEYKTRVGKREGGNTVFHPIVYKCSNTKCKYRIMTDNYGINTCSMCNEITNVIPPKNER